MEKFKECFKSLYSENEYKRPNQKKVIQLMKNSSIKIEGMFLDILMNGVNSGLKVENTDVIIQLWNVDEILASDENFPYFKEDVSEAILFGSDLGDSLYFYGKGKDGEGLYIVGGGVGNYLEESTKFANTFEEFFMEGKGIDTLVKWNNNTMN